MSLVLKLFMFSDCFVGHTGFGFGSMEQDLQRQQSVQIYSVNSGSKPAAFFWWHSDVPMNVLPVLSYASVLRLLLGDCFRVQGHMVLCLNKRPFIF